MSTVDVIQVNRNRFLMQGLPDGRNRPEGKVFTVTIGTDGCQTVQETGKKWPSNIDLREGDGTRYLGWGDDGKDELFDSWNCKTVKATNSAEALAAAAVQAKRTKLHWRDQLQSSHYSK